MPLVIPHVLVNGNVADAGQVNQNFQAIKDYLDTTKLDPSTSLQRPYAEEVFTFHLETVVGGTTRKYRFKNTSEALYFSQCEVAVETVAGVPSLSVTVKENGFDRLTVPLTWVSGVDPLATNKSTTGFSSASAVGLSELTIEVQNVAVAGQDANDVSVTLHCRKLHR